MFDAFERAGNHAPAALWGRSDKAIGFFAASIVPALFWMIGLKAGASALDLGLSGKVIALMGASIAAFLAAVFSALTCNSTR